MNADRSSHVLIVEARFYPQIADELLRGATAALSAAGATFDRVEVPGVFEIPAAIRMAVAVAERHDGYLALGCVIRGETTHYDIVANESARALQELVSEHALALGFGVLTVENEAQAWARAGVGKKNKGAEAAQACLAMIDLK
ncbi:MAG: 6,7-dimethyl-8-ribityllumazine synthase, partial [Burkholderiales bacterium]